MNLVRETIEKKMILARTYTAILTRRTTYFLSASSTYMSMFLLLASTSRSTQTEICIYICMAQMKNRRISRDTERKKEKKKKKKTTKENL